MARGGEMPEVDEERSLATRSRLAEGGKEIDRDPAGLVAERDEAPFEVVSDLTVDLGRVGEDHERKARPRRRGRGRDLTVAGADPGELGVRRVVVGGERGRDARGVGTCRREALDDEAAEARAGAGAWQERRSRRRGAMGRIGEGGVGDRLEPLDGLRVEVQRRVVQIVDAELHQHEIGLVADADVGEERGLGVGVVAAHGEVQDLDARPRPERREPGLEPLREGVLDRHLVAERDRVTEDDDAERARRLRASVAAVAEAVGIHHVADAVRGRSLRAGTKPVQPRAVGAELVQAAELLGGVPNREETERDLRSREPRRDTEQHQGEPANDPGQRPLERPCPTERSLVSSTAAGAPMGRKVARLGYGCKSPVHP